MNGTKKSGITLIELIIVITILAILGTLSYIYVIGSYANSRDALRLNNISNVKKVFSIERVKRGSYPEPDNAKDIYLDGKLILKQGVISDDLRERLEIGNTLKDPKYETDMSYSVSATQESYEIGTVLENNGAGTPSGFIIPQTYAAEYKSSYLNGNYNGKYYRTFSGGTTLIYALPSLTMNDTGTGDVSLYVNQATDKFSINGYGTIPESFSGITTEQTKINYIPRLLFSGNKCGVETDQEIVNFIALTRDAYNKEPFTYLRSYADVFDDYEYLKDNLIDFEKLKVLGVKINESLQCNINNFKTTDIFPTACGTENGIFDLMEDGFDIANSCIYTQSGDGQNIVRAGAGNLGTNGLSIEPSTSGTKTMKFKYRFFAYIPFKLSFDYKGNFTHSYQDFRFYIDDVQYLYQNSSSSGINTFQTYETVLLPPGIHELSWDVYASNTPGSSIVLDNISFSCVNGEANCAWTEGSLEPGERLPWDIFNFNGEIVNPWVHSTDASEGSYSITNPEIPDSNINFKYTYITYTKALTQAAKLSFDIKSDIEGWYGNTFNFYINGVKYLAGGDGSVYNAGFQTVTTPLLSPGTYEFKWEVSKKYTQNAFIFLDNINFTCIGGGGTCGWDDETMEVGAEIPSELFTFSGEIQTPWVHTSDASEGSYAITNPIIPDNWTNHKYTYLTYNKVFAQAQKFSFDIKTDIDSSYGNTFNFYINGVRYIYGGDASAYNGVFTTFTTPLLPAGDYEFKWEVVKKYTQKSHIILDNFQFSCIGGGGSCGWTDGTMENGSMNPWDVFNFSGYSSLPWNQSTNASEGTYAITSPIMPDGGYSGRNTYLTYNKTLNTPAKFNFDIKSNMQGSYGNMFVFFINGVEYLRGGKNDVYNSGFNTFTTPLLPAGDYEFKWRVYKRYSHNAEIWLDNIHLSCIGGGGSCGWTDETMENGSMNPWDVFNFSGYSSLPWNQSTNASEGTYAITSPIMPDGGYSGRNTYLTYNKTLSSPGTFSFDYKTYISYNYYGNAVYFYINDVEYLKVTTNGTSPYTTFTTPLLPAGNYEFKWRVDKRYTYETQLWLDNLVF